MNTITSIVNKDTQKVELRKNDPVKTEGVRAKQDASAESSDKVTLNATSTSDAPFDAEKVASIRNSIANGTFSIDSNKIADKILETFRK